MKINLNQSEIEAGVRMFIESRGLNIEGRNIEIDFTAGRSKGGLTADVDIDDAAPVQRPTVSAPRAPAEPVAEAKPATQPIEPKQVYETQNEAVQPLPEEPEFVPEEDSAPWEASEEVESAAPAEEEEPAPAAPAKGKKNSLFGG